MVQDFSVGYIKARTFGSVMFCLVWLFFVLESGKRLGRDYTKQSKRKAEKNITPAAAVWHRRAIFMRVLDLTPG